jgi:hypothetical protein
MYCTGSLLSSHSRRAAVSHASIGWPISSFSPYPCQGAVPTYAIAGAPVEKSISCAMKYSLKVDPIVSCRGRSFPWVFHDNRLLRVLPSSTWFRGYIWGYIDHVNLYLGDYAQVIVGYESLSRIDAKAILELM